MIREQLKAHGRALLQTNASPVPWARMAICMLATTAPLLLGWWQNHLDAALFAALIGYFVSLNDHLGTLLHRLLIAGLTFVMIALGFTLGSVLHGHLVGYLLAVAVPIYLLGLLGGLGAEAERMLLFATIAIVVVTHQPLPPPERAHLLYAYALFAYGVVLLGMILSAGYLRGRSEAFVTLSESLRRLRTRDKDRHLYAACFCAAVFVAISIEEILHLERGYWIVVTVMLVLRPDHRESLYRVAHRFVGTAVGVLAAELLLFAFPYPLFLIGAIALSAYLLPYAMKRNYAIASFGVSIFVVFLLALPHEARVDVQLALTRFHSTLYGCLISGAAALIYRELRDRWITPPA